MNRPDYDKSRYDLISFTEEWALLRSRSNRNLFTVARCVDGDWELNDTGDFATMDAKFMRMALPHGSGTLNVVEQDDTVIQVAIGKTSPTPAVEPKEPRVLTVDPYASNPLYGRF